MAVLKIKVASIVGRMPDLDKVTEICGKSEIFHPDNALSFYSDTSKFTPLSENNPYSEPLQRLVDSVNAARKRLTLVSEKDAASLEFNDQKIFTYVKDLTSSLNDLQNERIKKQKSIQELTQSLEQISHFIGLNLDLDEIHNCNYIKVRFGCLPKESYERLNSYEENPYIIFFPCSSDTSHYWGVYFSPIEVVSEVDRIFSSLYFERIRLTYFQDSPEKAVEVIRQEREVEINRIKEIDSKISTLWETERKTCLKVYSRLMEKSIYFGIRRYAARYHDNFILTGWIPVASEKTFSSQLERLDTVEYMFDKAEDEMMHSPPVKLKNKKPFRPFEFFVDMYGLPCYDEIDPTPFVAITYIILFGIMFGDLGQGLVVSIIGYVMWKLKGMKLGRILIPCGISSAIFGIVFGSCFGYENALDPFYRSVFGLAEKPVEVMETNTTNIIIYAAVGIGLVLVMIAMIINIYSSLKRKHYENALFGPNGIAGLVFYVALVFGFGGQIALGWNIVTPVYAITLIIIPLVAIFFREVLGGLVERRPDWKPESWGEFFMQNFFEVFEFLLSYATNTMSFLRVGAFVLVHAGMMLVVFTLADMSTGIVNILIVIVGNVFVMCLEGLLVGIQVLRLEFYEMFSRFFDGGGRPFRPVTVRGEV